MRSRSRYLAAAFLALAGCKEDAPSADPDGQSFHEAIRIVCDAPEQAEMPAESDPSSQAMLLASWIHSRVRNREVRQLIAGDASQTPAGKIDALERGARRAGLARCALAELWRYGMTGTSTGDKDGSSSNPELP